MDWSKYVMHESNCVIIRVNIVIMKFHIIGDANITEEKALLETYIMIWIKL